MDWQVGLVEDDGRGSDSSDVEESTKRKSPGEGTHALWISSTMPCPFINCLVGDDSRPETSSMRAMAFVQVWRTDEMASRRIIVHCNVDLQNDQ